MRVHHKIGSKERFKEMFEKVNKMKINESFDSPKEKDEKYLDKAVGQDEDQVSKYDDGVRYPVEKELKTKDPSLEKLKGDDAPIEENEKKKTNLTESKYIVLQDDYGRFHTIEIPDEKYEDHLDKLYHHFGTNSKYADIDFDPSHTYVKSGDILGEDTTPEEDQLLDPSTHWVDHYAPKNVAENGLNFPHPMADPEAGEQEWEEFEKWKAGEFERDLDAEEDEDWENMIKTGRMKPINPNESVNELDIPKDYIKAGARIPIKDISPSTFPIGQHLPALDTADAQQLMNTDGDIMRWRAGFIDKFGEEGDAVKSHAWWWNIEGNPKFEEWKDRRISAKAAWMNKEREAGRTSFLDHEDPMNEAGDNPMLDDIKYNYDEKGNWIPQGYEDKKVALRAVEKPLGSGNWKVGIVTLDDNGDLDEFIDTKDTWEQAKEVLHSSIT